MEVFGMMIGFAVLISPVYFKLIKIERRLTKIEDTINGKNE